MASQGTVLDAAQDVEEVAQLVKLLEIASNKSKAAGKKEFSCKKSSFPIPGSEIERVDSWRFQEWDYTRDDLPTYARGLFTYCSPQGKPEIVVRGYDKFFNTGEVAQTKWTNIESHTRGPYELSVKENGCIIFLAGMPNDVLLVCSKHSTGIRADTDMSHAVVGEMWVERHIAKSGRTKAELARELRRLNVTAVAELCDDAFEEHVLTYSNEDAGLYLHGLNLNLPVFATYPSHLVEKFAADWGFRKTQYLVKHDIHEVHTFLDHIAETGSWEGNDVEGFVVRCQLSRDGREPWVDWFFKYKFEEPYLMYRQWRECTRSIIAGKPPRYKRHQTITEAYLAFARAQFQKDPALVQQFNQNHGIIALRDAFLKYKGLHGSDLIREVEDDEVSNKRVVRDVMLVPIATLGCGKTTIGVALQKLFGWGHIQNDNIQVRGKKPLRFATECCALLNTQPVVFADRNNHQRRERKQIIDDTNHLLPGVHMIALHYVHDNRDRIRSTMRARVLARGDNHQTIHPNARGSSEVVGIMEGFMMRFESADPSRPPDDGFDFIIDLDPIATSRINLETVITRLSEAYPNLISKLPTSQDMDSAINAALTEYRPDIKHDLSNKFTANAKGAKAIDHTGRTPTLEPSGTKKAMQTPKIEYFCVILARHDVIAVLERTFSSASPEEAHFYRQINSSNRLQPTLHVTLVHSKNSAKFGGVWKQLLDRHVDAKAAALEAGGSSGSPHALGRCRVRLERAVWDDRVMCLVVRLHDAEEQGFETTNEVAHVTIGTATAAIKPFESNALLGRWLNEGSGSHSGIRDLMIDGYVVLDGVVQAVLAR